SRPRYSSSLRTERIEAGDRLIPASASDFDPTGWPLSMYPSTTRRKIARARSVSSLTGGEVMTAAYLVARGAAGKLSPDWNPHATIRPRARRNARHRHPDRLHQARRRLGPDQL